MKLFLGSLMFLASIFQASSSVATAKNDNSRGMVRKVSRHY